MLEYLECATSSSEDSAFIDCLIKETREHVREILSLIGYGNFSFNSLLSLFFFFSKIFCFYLFRDFVINVFSFFFYLILGP